MAVPPLHPRTSLDLIQPELDALCRDVEALTPEQWAAPSNCAGWQLADVVAHVTRNGESVLLAVRRALSGDTTPAFGPTMRAREDEMRASGPGGCASLMRREYDEMAAEVKALSDSQMSLTFPHPMGPRTVTWYCNARLNETTFHHWDIRHSLGYDGPLDEARAAYLLQFLLDAQPGIPDRRQERTAETFVLTAGDASWTVSTGPDGLRATPASSASGARTVRAPAGWLALALYGRTRIDRPEFAIAGPPGTADLFAAIFGQPG